MISISYLKPLHEACNIASVNHVSSEPECLRDSVQKRVKTFVGVTMAFTIGIKIITMAKFCHHKKNIDSTTTAFAECCGKFRGLKFIISS